MGNWFSGYDVPAKYLGFLNEIISDQSNVPLPPIIDNCALGTLNNLSLCNFGLAEGSQTMPGCGETKFRIQLHSIRGLGTVRFTALNVTVTPGKIDLVVGGEVRELSGSMSVKITPTGKICRLAAPPECKNETVTINGPIRIAADVSFHLDNKGDVEHVIFSHLACKTGDIKYNCGVMSTLLLGWMSPARLFINAFIERRLGPLLKTELNVVLERVIQKQRITPTPTVGQLFGRSNMTPITSA